MNGQPVTGHWTKRPRLLTTAWHPQRRNTDASIHIIGRTHLALFDVGRPWTRMRRPLASPWQQFFVLPDLHGPSCNTYPSIRNQRNSCLINSHSGGGAAVDASLLQALTTSSFSTARARSSEMRWSALEALHSTVVLDTRSLLPPSDKEGHGQYLPLSKLRLAASSEALQRNVNVWLCSTVCSLWPAPRPQRCGILLRKELLGGADAHRRAQMPTGSINEMKVFSTM
mmetsp:Transcript_23504/g.58502  ORF Transcript_23504/g.58502 Transcript_23504/m.58502 type:complete len:227 (+) Transcript_23504:248-928(+)